jgi:ABC-2 type transport system permease protein
MQDFLSVADEGRAFGRMRRRILATLFWQTLAESRFRVSLVAVLIAWLWAGMLWMFLDGFWFLQSTITQVETYARAVGGLLGIFFAALTAMLVLSTAIILYGSLFRSREIAFLLTLPARTQRVFLHKFQDAIVLSSWGFVLLVSPMLVAYGIAGHAAWWYYAMLLPSLVAFIYIPAAIGAIACLWVVRHMPNNLVGLLVAACGVLLLAGAWLLWGLLRAPESDLMTAAWFQDLLGRLQFSETYFLPSWWLCATLISATAGEGRESVMFMSLLLSNALLFRLLALRMAGRTYRAAYSRLYDRSRRRRGVRAGWFDRGLSQAIAFLPAAVRLLMIKDLRVFRRDPVQWSQFLLFVVLLTVYFSNIYRVTYDIHYVGWINVISFLNLAVVGLLLSTFTTRFIFPMISLEGRRFWILGLLPVRRETILWGKFLFAAAGSLVPCSALVLLSDTMLEVPLPVVLSHQLTFLVLCLGLSGIAVGLGAYLPNLREQSPSRIAAGFGGTLNLVLSTLYILVVVLLTALPIHFSVLAGHSMTGGASTSAPTPQQYWLDVWLFWGTVCSVVLGGLATWLPMWLGCRAFRRLEF